MMTVLYVIIPEICSRTLSNGSKGERFVRPTLCRSASCAVAVMLAPEIEQKRLCISLEEGGC